MYFSRLSAKFHVQYKVHRSSTEALIVIVRHQKKLSGSHVYSIKSIKIIWLFVMINSWDMRLDESGMI